MEEEKKKGFWFFRTNYEAIKELEATNPELALQFALAIMEYGLFDDYDKTNPIVNALMSQAKFGIDEVNLRRDKNKGDGKKGGRKEKYSKEEVWRLADEGKSKNEIAAILGCDERTVRRKLSERPQIEEGEYSF